MEEKKFVQLKKDEFNVREFIKKELGKGKMSSIRIEYTPIGEKIIITTNKPGYVIGRKGERITALTETLRKRFSLENPHIEMQEIEKPEFDSQYIADEIASSLERFGSMRFKVIAYRMLERIVKAGVLGVEIRISGKLPSERARTWRFAYGYLKKAGDTAKMVNRAESKAGTQKGIVGIKVAILSPDTKLHDQINVDEALSKIKENLGEEKKDEEENDEPEEAGDKKKSKTKKVKKTNKETITTTSEGGEDKSEVDKDKPQKKENKEKKK